MNASMGSKYLLLAIGIQVYDDKSWEVNNNADKEAEFFFRTMKECFNIDSDSMLLRDREAEKKKIKHYLNHYLTKGNNYNLIIYFAGHGTYRSDSKEGYIVPFDGVNNNKTNCISFTELSKMFEDSNLQHILLICDSCYAGHMFPLNNSRGADFTRVHKNRSRKGLSSSLEDEEAQSSKENTNRRNEFSLKLTKAIRDCASKGGSVILFNEIVTEFLKNFDKSEKLAQNPRYADLKNTKVFGGEMRLTKNPKVYTSPPLEKPNAPSTSVPPINTPDEPRFPPVQPRPHKKSNFLFHVLVLLGVIVLVSSLLRPRKKSQDYVTVGEEITKPRMNPVSIYSYEYSNDKVAHQNTERQDINVSYNNEEKSVPNTATLTEKSIDIPQDMSIVSVSSKSVVENIEPIPNSYEDIKVTNNGLVNVVFVGHFESKENAENWLASIKKLGYQKAEIVMKDKSPYFVVITGLHYNTEKAKNEVRSIKQKGIDVFYSLKSRQEIFRESH